MDRLRQCVGILGRGAQDVKGEALCGPVANTGQLRKLADQTLDRCGVDGQASEARQAEPTESAHVEAAGDALHAVSGELLGTAQSLVDGR